ncbi:GNAT family N-acetyltransferase [Dactylosporangium sp. AC04546]|uniref:GNAT family N-acetyltransferase n=1 Tax=Dactylosporangium sp. AC04546 TaxID=2862460 RepID=UPI003FA4A611
MVVGDEVEQVYVGGAHRGTGVAAGLLAAAERQVAANGYGTAWLAVVPGQRPRAAVLRALRMGRRRGVRQPGPARGRDHPGAVPPLREAGVSRQGLSVFPPPGVCGAWGADRTPSSPTTSPGGWCRCGGSRSRSAGTGTPPTTSSS